MSDVWDAEAATFDAEPDHGLADPRTRAAWLQLLTTYLPAAPARIADLGSGTGTLSVLLADAGYSVDGVDFSAAMVERARAKAGSRADVTFVLADAAEPPLESGGYDAVLCRHLLWALPDPRTAVERWIDLLTSSGRLLLIEGHWNTGAGLTASQTMSLAAGAGRTADLFRLTDSVYWGRDIDDERYLVVSRGGHGDARLPPLGGATGEGGRAASLG